jgi:hypothetical protein
VADASQTAHPGSPHLALPNGRRAVIYSAIEAARKQTMIRRWQANAAE